MVDIHKPINNYDSVPGFEFIAGAAGNRDKSLTAIGFRIISTLLNGYKGKVAIQLWDGRQPGYRLLYCLS
ncbi:MAG: hypothetical protein BMS9Abin09_0049 [Gammaproteobacteria bacterium]|nr:MAG: hypothetical protein BMS9Abin09_0049 [Gammaproteobacteria bacterium]